MVHFNHRLRDNMYVEWKDEYMNYKKLKRILHTYKKKASSTLKCNDKSSTSEDDVSSWSLVFNPPQSTLWPHMHREELQSLVPTYAEFEEFICKEYERVESSYKSHLSNIKEQFEIISHQYRVTASNSAKESIKYSLVELHRLLHHLQNFALLNYTGFIKILKKHDKILHKSLTDLHIQNYLQKFSFTTARECKELMTDLEQFFAKCFCDGNQKVSLAALMTRKNDFSHWEYIYIGIKIGTCLTLLAWTAWDSLLAPWFPNGNERHIEDLALTPAYPVYRGIGCILLLHWLVGLSIYVWRSARINYRYIFETDPRSSQAYTEVFHDATNLSILFFINILLYYKVINRNFSEQILYRNYYPVLLFLYTLYFYMFRRWNVYKGIWRTVFEIICSPYYSVTFFHTFIGDYLTSLVKVNQDISWSICFIFGGEFLSSKDVSSDPKRCSQSYIYTDIVIPLLCVLPLWWRFLQSLRRIHDSRNWWPNLPNATKYALAQVVALFGIFHPFHSSNSQGKAFQIFWVMLFSLSSLYTWVWDVRMDWGLGRREYQFLNDRRMFSRKWVYYAAIIADFFLRFSWTLTLIPPNTSHTLPLYLQPSTMVLELFRRTFWSFFRLENEHLRNTQGFRRVQFIPLHYDHGVGETNSNDEKERIQPMEARMFWMKILLIIALVIAFSLAAILFARE